MPNRIREETNDLLILDYDPGNTIIWGGIFVLFGIIAWKYYGSFILFLILGWIGISILYSFFTDESVTVDKKNCDIVINSIFSRREIHFSDVKNIEIWDDIWPGEWVSNMRVSVITDNGKFLIFFSRDTSSAEEVKNKINKLINPTTHDL